MFRMALWNYTTLTDVARASPPGSSNSPNIPPRGARTGVACAVDGCGGAARYRGPPTAERVSHQEDGVAGDQTVLGVVEGASLAVFEREGRLADPQGWGVEVGALGDERDLPRQSPAADRGSRR